MRELDLLKMLITNVTCCGRLEIGLHFQFEKSQTELGHPVKLVGSQLRQSNSQKTLA